jgi:D-beta-D-heptose 7-phosphate kinase/D-beta-D-heptose 1-phosphate adenosyltransferase
MINLVNKQPKILVIGDLMIDHYLWGECERISPEAPIPIVNIDDENTVLGGAGNVVNNLVALGAQTDILSVIGDCDIANELGTLLSNINVSTNHLVKEKGRLSSKKSRIIASHQQVIRYDRESDYDISEKSQQTLFDQYKKILKQYDIVLLSDYGKGVLTDSLTRDLIQEANNLGIKVLVDPKGINYFKYSGAYLLTPNKKEASLATNIDIIDDSSLLRAITQLKEKCSLNVSLITLSENGVAIYDNDLRVHPTMAREVYDVTGAGDTVLATLGYALSSNYDIDQAVEFANLAAGVVVGKIGSATASIDEINDYKSSLHQSSSEEHIKTLIEIEVLSTKLKDKGKKIVFTNGCFDILHAGHVRYLETAKSFGDILMVGVNSDKSVRTLKGETRPINSEQDRALLIASLEAVDYVIIFNEDTPYELINAIKPHTLVKGGDYAGQKVVGQDLVSELRLVNFIEGKSTTRTIEKIKSL